MARSTALLFLMAAMGVVCLITPGTEGLLVSSLEFQRSPLWTNILSHLTT